MRIVPGFSGFTIESDGSIRMGNAAGYAQFAPDGTLSFAGVATAFEDIQVNVALGKLPGDAPPSWTTFAYGIGGGVTFAVMGWSVNEYLDFTVQTKHAMQLNSKLHVHLHYTVPSNANGTKIKFQLDCIAAGVDTAFAVPTGSPFSNEATLTAAEAGYHRLLEVGEIPAVNTTVSTLYECRLKRIAATSNDYEPDVYVRYIDCHFEADGVGSKDEYSK